MDDSYQNEKRPLDKHDWLDGILTTVCFVALFKKIYLAQRRRDAEESYDGK